MGGGEVLLHKVLQDLDPHVWVVNLGEAQIISFNFIQNSLFYMRRVAPQNSGSLKRQTDIHRTTHRFHSVSDAHDQPPILLHLVDKLHGQHSAVERLAELLCRRIQSPSKPVTLRGSKMGYKGRAYRGT